MRYLLKQSIDFDQTCIDTLWKARGVEKIHFGRQKELKRFGDLDLIFKVTLAL